MPNRSPHRLLLAVPVVAGCLAAFELLTHRQLVFVSDARSAYLALSVAVIGLALSGWLTARAAGRGASTAQARTAWALPLTLAVCVGGLWLLGAALPYAAPLLLLPYLAGGVLLAAAFAGLPPSRVYALDLGGAAVGALLATLCVGAVGEEASQILLVGLSCAVPAILVGRRGRRLAVGLAVLVVAVAVSNLRLGIYDLARVEDRSGLAEALRPKGPLTPEQTELRGRTPPKLFEVLARTPEARHLHTVSSLAGRIDIISVDVPAGQPPVRVYENGNFIDIMFPDSPDRYVWDPRLPRGIFSEPPDIFVIGTSAEGILKTARNLGGEVAGAELNGAFIELVRGGAGALCGGCAEGVGIEIGDGRSALSRRTHRYAMITLMNAHVARGPSLGRAADAEFLHTRQAIGGYLDRLVEGGVINWEEPLYSAMGSRLTVRTLATVMSVLAQRGAAHPEDHVVAVEWGGAYQQLLVRTTPWGAVELAALRRWMAEVPRAQVGRTGPLPVSMVPLWLPDQRDLDNPLAAFLRTGRLPAGWSPEAGRPLDDDRPFPFSIPATRRVLARGFAGVAVVAVGAALALCFALLRRRGRAGRAEAVSVAAAAGLSGVAFMGVETLWMQQLQLLIGPPTTSFVVILVTVLAGSGLGAALSPRLSPRRRRAVLLAVPLLLLAHAGGLGLLSSRALVLPPALRAAVAIATVAPVSLAMGLPLPIVVRAAQARLAPGAGALLFGLNGTLGGLGVLGGLLLSSWLGFSATSTVGAVLYALVALSVWPSLRGADPIARGES